MQGVTVVSGFGVILTQLPQYLVWVAGAVVALARWQRHPRVSLLVLIGVALLLVDSLAGVGFNAATGALLAWRATRGNVGVLRGLLQGCRAVFSIVAAIGFGLVLGAVFVERAPQSSAEKKG